MAPTTHTRNSLVPMLAPGIEQPVAYHMVTRLAQALGCDEDRLSTDDALRILDRIAKERGPFGIAGRFARFRVVLRWM